jgi:hypothetical protein
MDTAMLIVFPDGRCLYSPHVRVGTDAVDPVEPWQTHVDAPLAADPTVT